MMKRFTVSPLKAIMEPVERPEVPIPGQEYRQIGVQLWGKGAYERETLDGTQTKYKTLTRVEKDDIIVNKIWARNGSVGVVTDSLAGCYASNEFPIFRPIADRLEPRWFHWYTKTSGFWRQCDEKSRGTSGKNRIRPERFLEILLPLPPLDNQRRIVARIEELSARVEEARALRTKSVAALPAILSGAADSVLSAAWPRHALTELLTEETQNGLSPRPSDETPGLPILRISAATSRGDAVVDESDYKFLEVSARDRERYQLRSGDLLACRFNGNLHFVGRFALFKGESGEPRLYPDKLIRFRVDTGRVLPEFVTIALNSRQGRSFIEPLCATTAGNIGIGATKLKTVPVPLPPIEEQRRIVAYLGNLQAKVDALKKLQEETAKELNALLPSILSSAFSGEL